MVQLGEDCDCSDDAWRDLGEVKLISDKVVRRGESSPDSPYPFSGMLVISPNTRANHSVGSILVT
jgi:hypothetical protein